ncbi:MAG TPA: response regulator, partial [Candidatus Binatia bacterium]|nr:response regulator [Candidatus Binatia bacterium]
MDQGKILVAEDEESLRFVLKKALEEEGYWVQTAVDGSGARQSLTDCNFDVALVDIKLPDVDGLTVLKESKDDGIDTAMIIMTAQNTMRNAIG